MTHSTIGAILNKLDWTTPYNASEGEKFYSLLGQRSFELEVVKIIFDGKTEINVDGTLYKLKESKYRDFDYVIYHF